jgi:DNA-binding LacI/PurR family transcriptional regulator
LRIRMRTGAKQELVASAFLRIRMRIRMRTIMKRTDLPVTARDIARELELSQPTVSRILSGDKRHRVARETRVRVMETAKRLGYQPNSVARSLRRGRTNIIGVHTSHNYDVRNDFYGTIIGALQHECGGRGLDILLHSALRGSGTEEMFGKLRDGRIDGLILHASPNDPLVSLLGQSSFPVVSVADQLEGLPGVICDDAGGMALLIDYLWHLGYRRFVYLAPQVMPSSIIGRRDAFTTELEKRGIGSDQAKIVQIDFENAAPVLDSLLSEGESTAVCCWNDRTAYNLLHICERKGILVPKQLAVAGFDGFRDSKMPTRQLLTVACPWEMVAATALRLLVGRIEGREVEDVCLPVALMTGDTA